MLQGDHSPQLAAGTDPALTVAALPQSGDNVQCSAATASESEVGETDVEILITDYEFPQTTDTEGNIERPEEEMRATGQNRNVAVDKLPNPALLREAKMYP